jgi:nucleoid-associated protein EbfC
MSGKFEITAVKIDPEAFNADDIAELEVMILAAAKDAHTKVSEAQQKLTSNIRIPGLF